jgi:hypothetical protein
MQDRMTVARVEAERACDRYRVATGTEMRLTGRVT